MGGLIKGLAALVLTATALNFSSLGKESIKFTDYIYNKNLGKKELVNYLEKEYNYNYGDYDPVLIKKLSAMKDNIEILKTLKNLGYDKDRLTKTDLENIASLTDDKINITELGKKDFYNLYQIQDTEIGELLKNRLTLVNSIYGNIQDKKYFYRKKDNSLYFNEKETLKQLVEFNIADLTKIYVLTEMLKSEEFCNKLGKEMGLDFKDKTTEHGGYFKLNINSDTGSYNLEIINMVPTEIGDDKGNETYFGPEELYNPENFLDYHFHACADDDSLYAGPSDMDLFTSNDKETSSIVVTRLDEKIFDVDFYDCYFDVVDLGVYNCK